MPARTIWFLEGGGLPLSAIGAQMAAIRVLGTPRAYFDHDEVMVERVRALGTRSFEAYVRSLLADETAPFSAFVSIADLEWLSAEPSLRDHLGGDAIFVHLCFRDPVLQAVSMAGDREDDADFDRIAEALLSLERLEATARAWLSERGRSATELMVEDLAAPGVAALRHLLDGWSLPLPSEVGIQPIEPPAPALFARAEAFRTAAQDRRWGQAVGRRDPHWRRRRSA